MQGAFCRQLCLLCVLCIFPVKETDTDDIKETKTKAVQKIPSYVIHRMKLKITVDGRIAEEDR